MMARGIAGANKNMVGLMPHSGSRLFNYALHLLRFLPGNGNPLHSYLSGAALRSGTLDVARRLLHELQWRGVAILRELQARKAR